MSVEPDLAKGIEGALQTMSEHTTHFDDCGCLSKLLKEELRKEKLEFQLLVNLRNNVIRERDQLKSMVAVYEAEHDEEAKKDQTLMEENLYFRKEIEKLAAMREVSDEGYRKLMDDFVALEKLKSTNPSH